MPIPFVEKLSIHEKLHPVHMHIRHRSTKIIPRAQIEALILSEIPNSLRPGHNNKIMPKGMVMGQLDTSGLEFDNGSSRAFSHDAHGSLRHDIHTLEVSRLA